jgi:hypothetical protein
LNLELLLGLKRSASFDPSRSLTPRLMVFSSEPVEESGRLEVRPLLVDGPAVLAV